MISRSSCRRFMFGGSLLLLTLVLSQPAALAEDAATLPDSGSPSPRVENYDSSFMSNTTAADSACSTLIEEGWSRVNPPDFLTPRVLEGEIVAGHAPHGDLYFNHDTEDVNFFVYPDNMNPLANHPDVNYWYLFGYGNFVTGEPKERGRIECEWSSHFAT